MTGADDALASSLLAASDGIESRHARTTERSAACGIVTARLALAGASLLSQSALSPIVAALAPFVMGLTLLFWAIGSFWIPMLAALGVWSHLIKSLPFAYSPLQWGRVFPLGMYSVCTYHLAQILNAPFLMPLSSVCMVVAVVAWTATFAGQVDSRLHPTFGGNSPAQAHRPSGSSAEERADT